MSSTAAPNLSDMTLKSHKTGSTICTALEAAYADVRANHPELPAVVFVTGAGTQRRHVRLGHYGHDRWTVGNGQAPELFFAGECLHRGAEAVLKTLLHEAAHGLAAVRKVKDTTRGGRYQPVRTSARTLAWSVRSWAYFSSSSAACLARFASTSAAPI